MSRWSDLADLLREAGTGVPVASAVCGVAADVLGSEWAALALVTTEGASAGVVGTDPVATALLEQELVLGEGPAVQALATGVPVLAIDLAGDDAVTWPLYAAAAAGAGVGAAVALPLRVGAASLGVLVGLRARPGAPSPAAFADALVVADLAVHALLAEQAAGTAGVPVSFAHAAADLDVLQQATGMVAERLGLPLGDALVRIRAHAFASDLAVGQAARSIVDGTLVLEG